MKYRILNDNEDFGMRHIILEWWWGFLNEADNLNDNEEPKWSIWRKMDANRF